MAQATVQHVPVPTAAHLEQAVAGYVARGYSTSERNPAQATLWKGRRCVVVTVVLQVHFSPDRMWWWDGANWRGCEVELPPGVPVSTDGHYWWDGERWRTTPAIDVRTL